MRESVQSVFMATRIDTLTGRLIVFMMTFILSVHTRTSRYTRTMAQMSNSTISTDKTGGGEREQSIKSQVENTIDTHIQHMCEINDNGNIKLNALNEMKNTNNKQKAHLV